jgi:molybdate transport system substrate-binding protein
VRSAVVAALLVLTGAGCSAAEATTVRVAAAASLTVAFTQIGAGFQQAHPGVEVDLSFAGSPTLVAQIREGAPIDVFASADEENMDGVAAAGLIDGTAVQFARNRLVIAVASGNPLGVTGPADLAGLRTAIGAAEVPVGRYAAGALARAGVALRRAVEEPSVSAIVAKLLLGEVDAGIVYQTDVEAAAGKLTAVPIPTAVDATYWVAVLNGAAVSAEAREFVDYLLSPAGVAALAAAGFEAP